MVKKDLKLEDFNVKSYVSWEELERVFGKRGNKKFMKWMFGQGCYPEGVFPWDLERYLLALRRQAQNK